jgi:ABC-type transporter Mla maintaining outer membrane lipid asymmetry ATPase subunit MlaF
MTTDQTPSNPGVPVIEMIGVAVGSTQNPDAPVLEDVDWRVESGEYWLLAGMHGSGKSDLIALAGGLMPPQRGIYRFFGHEMPIYEDALLPERLRLGLVFDGGHLLHRQTVAENLALPLQYHRNVNRHQAAARVEAMLELTGLTPWADSLSGSLTRNWQKRAGLARALMLEPEVLLLDNPLGGLDLRHMNWWLDFLGLLSSGGGFLNGRRMTLVATGEDLRPWKERADHFAILQHGRLVTLGRRSALAGHREPLVRELLAEGLPGGG